MAETALLVVDVQNDFAHPDGSLYVAGGEKVAVKCTEHIQESRDRYKLIIFSKDWHKPDNTNGGHIARPNEEVDFSVGRWPGHCYQGQWGSDFHPAIDPALGDGIVYKGDGKPAASAFEGKTEHGIPLDDVLLHSGITHVHVIGIATDVCVKATAIDAHNNDYTTTVIWDLTAAVGGRVAMVDTGIDLSHRGIQVHSLQDLQLLGVQ